MNVKNVVDIERCWKTRRNLKKLEEAESYRSNRTWMRTNVSFFYSLLEGYFSHEKERKGIDEKKKQWFKDDVLLGVAVAGAVAVAQCRSVEVSVGLS